ncbi:MAG: hypothetical protein LBD75_01585 [Candidatus Peribacteria bacterium]|nr:hypothetical protein [Candidatus Peribacteria bacterium]
MNYEPVVSDTDALITGVVKGIDMDEEHYIQIQSEDGKYSSNKIKLKNGKFVDTVLISE